MCEKKYLLSKRVFQGCLRSIGSPSSDTDSIVFTAIWGLQIIKNRFDEKNIIEKNTN
jgi:hypothetical protein